MKMKSNRHAWPLGEIHVMASPEWTSWNVLGAHNEFSNRKAWTWWPDSFSSSAWWVETDSLGWLPIRAFMSPRTTSGMELGVRWMACWISFHHWVKVTSLAPWYGAWTTRRRTLRCGAWMIAKRCLSSKDETCTCWAWKKNWRVEELAYGLDTSNQSSHPLTPLGSAPDWKTRWVALWRVAEPTVLHSWRPIMVQFDWQNCACKVAIRPIWRSPWVCWVSFPPSNVRTLALANPRCNWTCSVTVFPWAWCQVSSGACWCSNGPSAWKVALMAVNFGTCEKSAHDSQALDEAAVWSARGTIGTCAGGRTTNLATALANVSTASLQGCPTCAFKWLKENSLPRDCRKWRRASKLRFSTWYSSGHFHWAVPSVKWPMVMLS